MRSASTVPPVLPPLRALALPGEARVRIGAWSIPLSLVLHALVLAALLTPPAANTVASAIAAVARTPAIRRPFADCARSKCRA